MDSSSQNGLSHAQLSPQQTQQSMNLAAQLAALEHSYQWNSSHLAQGKAALNAWYQQEAIGLSALQKFEQAHGLLGQNNDQAKKLVQEGFAFLADLPAQQKEQWLPFLGSKKGWTLIYDLGLQSLHTQFIASIPSVVTSAVHVGQPQKTKVSAENVLRSSSPENNESVIQKRPASPKTLEQVAEQSNAVSTLVKQKNSQTSSKQKKTFAQIVSEKTSEETSQAGEPVFTNPTSRCQSPTRPLGKQPKKLTPAEEHLKKLLEGLPIKNLYPYSLKSDQLYDQAWNQIDEKEHERLLKQAYAQRCEELQQAYDDGEIDPEKTKNLAYLYLKGKSNLKNKKAVKKSLQLLEECAQTCPETRFELACMLYLGKGSGGLKVQKDLTKAAELLTHESVKDRAEAPYLLGKILIEGVGGTFEDIGSARGAQTLFQMAVNRGSNEAQEELATMNRIVKNFEVVEDLFCRLSLLKVDNKGEEQQIQSLLDIFKEGLKHGCEPACEQAVQVLGTIRNAENRLANRVKAVASLFNFDTTETKRFAFDAAQDCITNLWQRVLDETARGRKNFPKGSKEEHQLACDRFNTKVALSMMEGRIVPLIEERIKSRNDVLAHHFKYTWLHAKLFHTIGNKADQTKWLNEAEKFASKLLESNKNGIHQLAGSFLHILGTIYEKNSEKSNACFKKAWEGCTCHESGKMYAQNCLLEQARGFHNKASKLGRKSRFADALWNRAFEILLACADPEKGNDADTQGLLAGHYFAGNPVGYKSLGKNLKEAERYGRFAANQNDTYGHRILGVVLHQKAQKTLRQAQGDRAKAQNREALKHLMLAMQADREQWGLLPVALHIAHELQPQNTTIQLCYNFVDGLKPIEDGPRKGQSKTPFLPNVKKNILEMMRAAELNEDRTFKEPLAAVTVGSCMQSLREAAQDPSKGQMLYPFIFNSKLTRQKKLEKAKQVAIKQMMAIATAATKRGIDLSTRSKPTKPAPVETSLATSAASTENSDQNKAAQIV